MTSASKVASLYLEASTRSYGDNDPSAPWTPWGPAQQVTGILRGMRWYSCAGHGGLGIADGMARKLLSAPGYRMGIKQGGYVFYEEDDAWAIPFFEHPEWLPYLHRAVGGKLYDRESLLQHYIKPYHASYLARYEAGEEKLKPKPVVGQTFKFTKPVSWGKFVMPVDMLGMVLQVRPTSITFKTPYMPDGARSVVFRIPMSYWDDGTLEFVE